MLYFFARRLNELHTVKREERGFTLIELLVVVIIIGILAAIAIPMFLAQRERAEKATVESDLRNAGAAYTSCWADTGLNTSCDTTGELEAHGFNTSPNMSFTYATSGTDNIVITGTHTGGSSGTFSSTTGRVSVT